MVVPEGGHEALSDWSLRVLFHVTSSAMGLVELPPAPGEQWDHPAGEETLGPVALNVSCNAKLLLYQESEQSPPWL